MKFIVYSVHDRMANTYAAPFIQRDGAVTRTLNEIFKQSPMSPNDFDLYVLGEFDNETGELKTAKAAKVGCVADLIFEGKEVE